MRRIAFPLAICCCVLAGCHKPDDSMEPDQTAGFDYGTLSPDVYMSDSSGSPGSAAVSNSGTEYGTQPTTLAAFEPAKSAQKIHVVAKGDTLFKLARVYYKDASRWKDIYQANQSTLADPNLIRVGQELVIP